MASATKATEEIVTLRLTLKEAAVLACAARNFHDTRQALCKAEPGGYFGLKKSSARKLKEISDLISPMNTYEASEAVWNYKPKASSSTPESSGPESSGPVMD